MTTRITILTATGTVWNVEQGQKCHYSFTTSTKVAMTLKGPSHSSNTTTAMVYCPGFLIMTPQIEGARSIRHLVTCWTALWVYPWEQVPSLACEKDDNGRKEGMKNPKMVSNQEKCVSITSE